MAGLRPGDEVTFRLHVTSTESWVDQITRIGTVSLSESKPPPLVTPPPVHGRNPLWYYNFTNELGQPVSLNDFHGQALAITFHLHALPPAELLSAFIRKFSGGVAKTRFPVRCPDQLAFPFHFF